MPSSHPPLLFPLFSFRDPSRSLFAPRPRLGAAWFRRFLKILTAVVAFGQASLIAAETRVLHSVADIRSVESWELRQTHRIQLTGTLTLLDPERQVVVLQDATGAIALNMDREAIDLRLGQTVTISAEDGRPYTEPISGFPVRPSGQEMLSTLETPANFDINYLSRLRGYLSPPVSGDYRFWISSDDSSSLWLGTNDDPQSARWIAGVTSWTQPRDWSHLPSQKSEVLFLEAGRRYYIEAIHEQHGGADHLSVSWAGPSMPQQIVDGAYLTPWQEEAPSAGNESGATAAPTKGKILREYWRNISVANADTLVAPVKLESTFALVGTRIHTVGTGERVSPRPVKPGARCDSIDDCRWCEMEGTVAFVGTEGTTLFLEITESGLRSRIVVKDWLPLGTRQLMGRRVRVQGVADAALNDAGQLVTATVWTAHPSALTLLEHWPQLDDYRTTTIAELLMSDSEVLRNRPVKVRGQVVETGPAGRITIEDSGAFFGSTSDDGKDWKSIGPPIEIPMKLPLEAGLVATSRSAETTTTAVFDFVQGLGKDIRATSIGGASQEGSFTTQNGRYIIVGSGHDIWTSPDQFYFVHHRVDGEAEIIAHLAEFTPVLTWAKTGIMMRAGMAPDAAFIDLVVTGDHGVLLQWRKAAEGSTPLSVTKSNLRSPQWLKLARRFSTVRVATTPTRNFAVGTPVEVVGYAVTENGTVSLLDASCRELPTEAEHLVLPTAFRPLAELAGIRRASINEEPVDPVKVRGIVTYCGDYGARRVLAVQDSSGAAFFSIGQIPGAQAVRVGHLIEINNPNSDGTSATLGADSVQVLGMAQLPKPLRHPAEYALDQRGEASWIEVDGIVRSVSESGLMQLKDKGEMFTVAVLGGATDSLRPLIDARLRVRGVIAYPSEKERVLLVQSTEHIEIVNTPSAQPLNLTVQRIGNLTGETLANPSLHRVKVIGQVTWAGANFCYIEDESGGARIDFIDSAPPAVRDRIEVGGFPDLAEDRSPILSNALVRKTGVGTAPMPASVSPGEVMNGRYNTRLIRVQATFLRDRLVEGDRTLELQMNQRIFRASISSPTFPSIPSGSLIEVTGVCIAEAGTSDWIKSSVAEAPILPIRLLLRAPNDLVVLQKPRWWAVKQTLLVTGVSALGLLVSVIWIGLLRRRVTQRSAELQAAMEKLKHETQAAATLAERNRLAGEIHDSLEQGFSGLIFQLDTTAKLGGCPSEVRAGLALARNMVAFSRNEVRHAVWDLHSPVLENSNLNTALHEIVEQLVPDAGHVTIAVNGPTRPLSSAIEHHLLRIAQEAITNSIKHAKAKNLDIVLGFTESAVSLSIQDDGCGFEPEKVLTRGLGHFGLRSLQGRARKIQGKLAITSSPGQGTRIEVVVPIHTS